MAATRTYRGVSIADRQAARRARLLHAAEELVADGGLAKLTVTGVCRRARLTERYFYESFTGRDALIDGLITNFATERAATIFAAAALGTDARERLRHAVGAVIDLLTGETVMGRLVADLAESGDLVRHRRAFTDVVVELSVGSAEAFFGEAPIQPDEIPVRVRFLIAGATEILFDWLDGGTVGGRDDFVRTSANLLADAGSALLGRPDSVP